MAVKSSVSVINMRVRRHLEAPIASRIAISRCLAVARERCKIATLVQAINRMSVSPAMIRGPIQNRLARMAGSSPNDPFVRAIAVFLPGVNRSSREAITCNSEWACARVFPCASLPSAVSQRASIIDQPVFARR